MKRILIVLAVIAVLGVTAIVAFSVKTANTPPVAEPGTSTTPEDTPKPIALAGTDADGDPLTYSVATQPAHGTLSGTAPELTYSPGPNFHGADSFTFKVNDGQLDSASVTLTIDVSAAQTPLPPSVPVPALNSWATWLIVLLTLYAGLYRLHRRPRGA